MLCLECVIQRLTLLSPSSSPLALLFIFISLQHSNSLLFPFRIFRMEGPMHYRPSGAPVNGTSPKLVHFPRISSDTSPLKQEATIDTSRKYHRSVFDIFSFLRSKRQEKLILIRDPDLPERKAPLKPTIQRHSILKMESSVEATPYRWPHDGSLDPKTTALVIIDMQKDCKFDFTFLSRAILQPSSTTSSARHPPLSYYSTSAPFLQNPYT